MVVQAAFHSTQGYCASVLFCGGALVKGVCVPNHQSQVVVAAAVASAMTRACNAIIIVNGQLDNWNEQLIGILSQQQKHIQHSVLC